MKSPCAPSVAPEWEEPDGSADMKNQSLYGGVEGKAHGAINLPPSLRKRHAEYWEAALRFRHRRFAHPPAVPERIHGFITPRSDNENGARPYSLGDSQRNTAIASISTSKSGRQRMAWMPVEAGSGLSPCAL